MESRREIDCKWVETTIIVIRDGVIEVRPCQTVPEINFFEMRGCHLLLKAVIVLFLVAIIATQDFLCLLALVIKGS